MKDVFTPKEVARLIGISYRQIQYWDKTNLLKPSYRRRGKYRLYNFTELIQFRVIKTMREHGFSIQRRIRRMVKTLKSLLPQVHYPLAESTFLLQGDRIMVFNGEVVMNKVAEQNYIRFDVRTLTDEIDKVFPQPVEGLGAAAG